jgi:hypothetical protein
MDRDAAVRCLRARQAGKVSSLNMQKGLGRKVDVDRVRLWGNSSVLKDHVEMWVSSPLILVNSDQKVSIGLDGDSVFDRINPPPKEREA